LGTSSTTNHYYSYLNAFTGCSAAALSAGEGDVKPEPIKNRGPRVGRNDPCPCGSGRKYKQCCMRQGGNGTAG